jgi:mediator of RNA polymerase II transcription subunit 12
VRQTPEDANEREMRKEVRAILPELFGGEPQPNFVSTAALLEKCPTLMSAPRFEQVRTLKQWLLPILRKGIASQESEINVLRLFCTSVELMVHAQCFTSILELVLAILEHVTTADLLIAVVETVHRYATIWTCMNAMGSIAAALYTTHQVWRTRGIQSRPLLALLIDIDNGRHLDKGAREQVATDIAAFSQVKPQSNSDKGRLKYTILGLATPR